MKRDRVTRWQSRSIIRLNRYDVKRYPAFRGLARTARPMVGTSGKPAVAIERPSGDRGVLRDTR